MYRISADQSSQWTLTESIQVFNSAYVVTGQGQFAEKYHFDIYHMDSLYIIANHFDAWVCGHGQKELETDFGKSIDIH